MDMNYSSFSEWLFLGIAVNEEVPSDDPVKRFALTYLNERDWVIDITTLGELLGYVQLHATTLCRSQIAKTGIDPSLEGLEGFAQWAQYVHTILDKYKGLLGGHLFAARTAWNDYEIYLGEQDDEQQDS